MSARAGTVAKISRTAAISNITVEEGWWTRPQSYMTRQARSRGMAAIYETHNKEADESIEEHILFGGRDGQALTPHSRINLAEVRAALDAVTLDEAEEATFKLHAWGGVGHYAVAFWPGNHVKSAYRPSQNKVTVSLDERTDRIAFTFPCGETRRYRLKTIDRALLALGY